LSRGGGRSGPDKVVVEWKYGKITQSEIRRRMLAEYIIQDFQQELIQRALAKKGRPKTAPVARAQNEQELVRRIVLAKKAESLGIVINDDALLDYFDLVSDESLKNRQEYLALLRSVADKRLNYAAVLDQLRIDLLSQRMVEISIGSTMSLSPGQLWQYYQKLHRQVVCDILPISAESQLDKVPESPPQSELRKLYEQGKDRYPDPLSPKPGFKIRRKASFGYFRAVFNDFLQKHVEKVLPTITDEEIKQYYEQNKRLYQIIDLPSEESDSGSKQTDEKKDDNRPDAEKTGDKSPSTTPPSSPKDQPHQTPTAGDSNGDKAKRQPGNPSDTKKDKQEANSNGKNKSDGKTKSDGKKTPPPQSSHHPTDSAFYVLAQQDSPQKKQPPGKSTEKTTESTGAEQAKKAQSPTGEPQKSPPAEKTPPGAASSDKPQTAPKEKEKQKEADKPSPPVRYKPLDDELKKEIREKIARERVTADATTEMQLAIEAARRSVERYANAWALWKDPALKRAKPKLPDFAALAKKYGLEYHTTPPLDLLEIAQLSSSLPDDSKPYLELLQATELNLQARSGNPTIMFRDLAARLLSEETPDDVPRFQPQMISSPFAFGGSFGAPQQVFLFWVAEVQPERVPQLEEVRDRVTEFWRYREAYRRAAEYAKQLIARADAEKKPLKETLSESERNSLITTEPFSWMTTGAVGTASRQPPMLSPVRGKNGKGEEVVLRDLGDPFMEEIFRLHQGKNERTITHDLPEKNAFAVELVREVVGPEQLRELFLVSGSDITLRQLAQEDRFKFFTEWYDRLSEEFEVQWVDESS